MPKQISIIPDSRIIGKIYFIRGEKVMLDNDLAELYRVTTGNLNKAVKRNAKRFPADFMFQLNDKEADIFSRFQNGDVEQGLDLRIMTSKNKANLRFQNGTSSYGGRRYKPYVFTEQGVSMLSSVLKSDRAIQVNIQIMRTFTKMRRLLATNKELKEKIEKMEKKYDKNFKVIFKVIAGFMKTDFREEEMKIIGFDDKK